MHDRRICILKVLLIQGESLQVFKEGEARLAKKFLCRNSKYHISPSWKDGLFCGMNNKRYKV